MTPQKIAIIDDAKRISYEQFAADISSLSAVMVEIGVKAHDSCLVMCHNSYEYFLAWSTVQNISAQYVPISPNVTPFEFDKIIDDTGASICFIDNYAKIPSLDDLQKSTHFMYLGEAEAGPGRPSITTYSTHDRKIGQPQSPKLSCSRQNSGTVMYSSGTTGPAQSIVRKSGKASLKQFLTILSMFHFSEKMKFYFAAPLYHGAPNSFFPLVCAIGGTIVLRRCFEPNQTIELLSTENITHALCAPVHLHRMVKELKTSAELTFSDLSCIISTGSALPTDLRREVLQYFGPVLYDLYGATELGFVLIAPPKLMKKYPQTNGYSFPGCSIHIHDCQQPQNKKCQSGELYASNPWVIPDKNARNVPPGFRSAGDFVVRTGQGLYTLKGRKDDIVISGGVNIYVNEIEELLFTNQYIYDVAVIGVPDAEWGQKLIACIVLNNDTEEIRTEIRRFVTRQMKEKFSGFKIPKEIMFYEALPRNEQGKVLKRALKNDFSLTQE